MRLNISRHVCRAHGDGHQGSLMNVHRDTVWYCAEYKQSDLILHITTCRWGSHLHSRADWCEGIHLGKADRLTVHSWGLLDHNWGARLALRPWRRRGVGWFRLIKENIKRDIKKIKLNNKLSLWCFNCVAWQQHDILTCVLNLGLNSLAFGFRVDFLTWLQSRTDSEKVII